MKLMKLILCAAVLSFAVVACDRDDEEEKYEPADKCYVGELSVDQNDGTTFKQQNVEVKCDIDTDAAPVKMTIYMNKVKFAEAMPIKLDMTIPAVDCTVSGGRIDISGDGIVPLAMGGEFPKYTITDLRGTIENGTMTLSMTCGEYPLSYIGTAAE